MRTQWGSLLGGALLATASMTPQGMTNFGKNSARKIGSSFVPKSKKKKPEYIPKNKTGTEADLDPEDH